MPEIHFKKLHVISILMLIISITAFAQGAVNEKIVLESGKSYTGEIVFRNDEVIILKLNDGTRFQFTTNDIQKIEPITADNTQKSNNDNQKELIFSGIIELTGGVAAAHYKTSGVMFSSASIAFGSDNFGNGTFFLGVGTSIFSAYLSTPETTLSFIPLYIKGRKIFRRSIVSPYLAMDMGYAFVSAKDFEGGIYSKINIGIQRRITYKTSIFGGAHLGVTGFGGNLTEQNANGSFTYYGKTAFVSGGLSMGIQF